MRPVDKGPAPTDEAGAPKVFQEYGHARRDLIDRMGQYCSYCEAKLPTSLAVEHVKPKSINPDLERDWNNFLLGCTNCNSVKGSKEVDLDDYVWPDSYNTFQCFVYLSDGSVSVPEGLHQDIVLKANELIALVGLDRKTPEPGTTEYAKASDRRYENRLSAYVTAQDVLNDLESAPEEAKPYIVQNIYRIVEAGGFWSVWMTVFDGYTEVKYGLVEALPGTCKGCFDNDGNPVTRP